MPRRSLRFTLLAASLTVCFAAAHGCAEGGGIDDTSGPVACGPGYTSCDGACVNIFTDAAHCGRCGSACGADQACVDGSCAALICTPGAEEPCYSGPAGTEGVGPCRGGTHVCDASGAAFGACEGEVAPGEERCDTLEDEDCDGIVNGGCVYPSCADLPAGAPSDVYQLDPDGAGPVSPFAAYCEMEIDGGGWTLVASVADGSYFGSTLCSRDCTTGAQVGACDEAPFTFPDAIGSVDERLSVDHKSRAYSTVPFREFLFVDSRAQHASYEIAGAIQPSVADWYPQGLQNHVAAGVEAHSQYSYPVNVTNVALSSNNCGSLRLSFNVEDSDTPIGAPCHETKKGPSWPKTEGDGCFWDEAGVAWSHDAFYRGNDSEWRLWLVR